MEAGESFKLGKKVYEILKIYHRQQSEKDLLLCEDKFGLKECFQRCDLKLPLANKTFCKSKKIEQVDDDGNVIATFKSIAEAARELTYNTSSIINICNGTAKSGRYKFRYAEVEDD